MRKLAAIALVILFATIVLPLAIVFVMEKAIDNDPHGSAETLEDAAQNSADKADETDETDETDNADDANDNGQ